MAWSLLAHTIKANATTTAVDTTGADLLVVAVSAFNGSPLAISDSKSNTWSHLTQQGTSEPITQVFYCTPSSVGSGHTFSVTSGGFYAIAVQAWSGSGASPFDVQNGAQVTGVNTVQPGSITPSVDNELVVCVYGTSANTGSGGTFSIDSSFTVSDTQAGVSGTNDGVGMAYLTQTTATAVNPTWTKTGNPANMNSLIVSFKAAAGGGGGGTFIRAWGVRATHTVGGVF